MIFDLVFIVHFFLSIRAIPVRGRTGRKLVRIVRVETLIEMIAIYCELVSNLDGTIFFPDIFEQR